MNTQPGSVASGGELDAPPLANVRVVAMTHIVAGPCATRVLADLGAEVINIESFNAYDPLRFNYPVPGGEENSLNRAPLWANMNRNKRSVSFNLWHPDALELLKRLITVSDILVVNFRPSVMVRWGLTYEDVAKLSPDIIYVSISGFGLSGRTQDYVTWGPTAQALSGLTYMSGLPGHQPAGIGFSYLDHFAGYSGAYAALAALQYRQQTGQGQHIDTTQVEAGAALTGPNILDRVVNGRSYERPGNPPGTRSTHRQAAPEGVYPCQGEDQWCAITVRTDEEWQGLAKALGDPPWTQDDRFTTVEARYQHRDELDEHLAQETRRFSKYDLMHLLQSHRIAAGAVQSPQDRAENDPQLVAREAFWSFHHPEFGIRPTDGLPFTFSHSRTGETVLPPPRIGNDNDYVLKDVLGVSQEEADQLLAEGAI